MTSGPMDNLQQQACTNPNGPNQMGGTGCQNVQQQCQQGNNSQQQCPANQNIMMPQPNPPLQSYNEVYAEVLEYSIELFRVINQTGGPFAQHKSGFETVAPQDLTNLAHSVTGMLLHMNWAEIAADQGQTQQNSMNSSAARPSPLPDRSNTIKGKILEALGVFLKMKMKSLDDLIPSVCEASVQMRANPVITQFHARMAECFQKSSSSTATPDFTSEIESTNNNMAMQPCPAESESADIDTGNLNANTNAQSTTSKNEQCQQNSNQDVNGTVDHDGTNCKNDSEAVTQNPESNNTVSDPNNGDNAAVSEDTGQAAAGQTTAVSDSNDDQATQAETDANADRHTSPKTEAMKAEEEAFKRELGQFLFMLWIDIQQPAVEMSTIGSILVGSILNTINLDGIGITNKDSENIGDNHDNVNQITPNYQSSSLEKVQSLFRTPQEVLSVMACKLNDLTSQLIRLSMELYHRTGYMNIETSRPKMASFFQYYTIDVTQSEMSSSLLSSHTTAEDPDYWQSLFSIQLVDSFAALLELLKKVENLTDKVIAVDFEGVRLCRNGPLCLIQMTLSDDPTTVYVIDIFLLNQTAISGVQTANGTSLKSILESDEYEKVWFDPRNDSDALYHQFGVYPRRIFDLQLAEVAQRRSQGLTVNYVQGLNKVLVQCNALDNIQKQFSEHIGFLGKNLFEPSCGGDYGVFQKRPLDPQILVYSAHDARYMLELRNCLLKQIKEPDFWIPRVFQAGAERANWCLLQEYYVPNSDAPLF